MDGSPNLNPRLLASTDHFDGRRFFNPHAPHPRTATEVRRWRRERRKELWPERVEVPFFPPPSGAAHDRIAATFIGHSTFLVQIGGLRVLTDPIWSERCSPVLFAGPRRARRPGQSLDALPGVDLLLVSHNHYDHMDLPTLREVRTRWAPPVATGLRNAHHLAKAGIRGAVELDWWDSDRTRGRAGHLCAGATFFGAHAAGPRSLAVGRVRGRGQRGGRVLCRRFRLLSALRGNWPPVPADRSRIAADRGI